MQAQSKISGSHMLLREAMSIKITRDILEGHLMCKYKSYLKLIEEDGQTSEYGQLLQETRARISLAARDKLLARYGVSDIVYNLLLQPAVLKQGASLLLSNFSKVC
jgi:hypothetical protein